jgi:hypothetical protein
MKAPHRMPLLALAFLSISALLFSCSKENSSGSDVPPGMNRLSVYLTDGPLDFQNVFVDIQGVEVKIDTCEDRPGHPRGNDDDHHHGCDDHHDSLSSSCEVWQSLNINPGVYDVLALNNGIDTLLGASNLYQGHIERIKITLGSNNSVVVDSVTHPLNLLNNQSVVYINLRREHLDSLSSNQFQLFLDFNLPRSIRYFAGQYWLSPVLIPFGQHATGSISGRIRPQGSYSLIQASSANDTSYAIPHHGEFKIRGLNPGNYSVYIQGANGYQDTTINNVMVEARRTAQLGEIQLHP